jgi:serine phosphatase RsbU (regulator of sigma subunit)
MSDLGGGTHTLMCSEVWGGNRKIVRAVRLPSVTAWVASVPLNEGEGGGDLYYMLVCDHDLISRVPLADVSGHGRTVSSIAETLQRLMRENINVWDQSDFMRGLNDTFVLSGQNKYATAIVLSFEYTDGVTEAENETGQSLDREQLLKWARETATDSPDALGRALLERLESFQGRCRNDDETLLVLQRERASLVASLGEVAVNHFGAAAR